jgi:hypothetical protein
MLPFEIGRNVVNLQRFEQMLKLIILRSDVRGYASELARIHQAKAKKVGGKSLGLLVGEFFDTVYSNGPFNDGPANELNEIWMSLGFRIELDKDGIDNRKRQLDELVKERNWLIHSALAELDFNSEESCKKLISQLDEQDDRLKPHYESLMRLIGNIHEAQQELFKQFLAHLRESARDAS